jgi:hypothetical protein
LTSLNEPEEKKKVSIDDSVPSNILCFEK